MKKNGFTLIELIVTIGLLGMLATIVITVSARKINQTKEKARETMVESIELAAKNYVTDYSSELTQFVNNDNIYVTLQTLVEKEYFTESLIDPISKKSLPLSNEVYVTREENGKITCIYNENQITKPKITLIGSYNQYVKMGDVYNELGVTAISPYGEDISSSVTVSGTVDTTIPNTYKITYEIYDVKITRNIIVHEETITSQNFPLITNYIESLYKKNNSKNYDIKNTTARYFNSSNKEVTVSAGLRYVGENSSNYVYYNCDDTDTKGISYGKDEYDYENSCEVWRIIGVFDVKNERGTIEKRAKIVNALSTFEASWDSSAGSLTFDDLICTGINYGWGINQWGASTYSDGSPYEGADLMRLLNGYYIGTDGATCTYCNDANQGKCSQICTKEELTNLNMKPLTITSKKLIENAVWDTYAAKYYEEIDASKVYLEEKGISAQYTGNSERESLEMNCVDTVMRTTKWTGLVGLMSASDIMYGKGWLSNFDTPISPWLITPGTAHNEVAVVRLDLSLMNPLAVNTFRVNPTLYLKSNVKIIGGNGNTVPYKLGI